MAEETRYEPGVTKRYEGEGIVVAWEPSLCIHTGNCLQALPAVFDAGARPWVKIGEATADQIAAAIERCPTGALRYERTDGAAQEAAAIPTTVQPRRNGPLFVRGSVEVVDADGNRLREGTRLALCRCGESRNKPYCDLSHRAAGFKA